MSGLAKGAPAAAFVLLAACSSTPRARRQTVPADEEVARSGRAEQTGRPAASGRPSTRARVDLSGAVFATAVVPSLDGLVGRVLDYIRPSLPPPLRQRLTVAGLRARLFRRLSLGELAALVDTRRPLAAALIDPGSGSSGLQQQLLLALPVGQQRAAQLLTLLERRSRSRARTADGAHVFHGARDRKIFVRFVERETGRFALVAGSKRLLDGAPSVLDPLLADRSTVAARVVLEVQRLVRRYRRVVQLGLALLTARADRAEGSPSNAILGDVGSSWLQRWLRYLTEAEQLELRLNAGRSALRLDAHLAARAGTRLARYLESLPRAAPWGVGLLPRRSAIALVARGAISAERAAHRPPRDATTERAATARALQMLLEPLTGQLARFGELAAAAGLYASSSSVLGAAGGVRVERPAAEVRGALHKACRALARRSSKAPFARKLHSAKLRARVRFRRQAIRLDGQHRGALLTLQLRGRDRRGRRLARVVHRLVSGNPRLAYAVIDSDDSSSVVLWAAGSGYRRALRERFAALRDAAGGAREPRRPSKSSTSTGSGLIRRVEKRLANRKPALYAYISGRRLVQQAMTMLGAAGSLSRRARALGRRLAPPSSGEIAPLILSISRKAQKGALLRLELSAQLMSMLARTATLW